MPLRQARAKTQTGVSMPARDRSIISEARKAYIARIAHSMARPPSRSPSTPNMGAASVPRNWSDAKPVSSSTEPVWTITYQPRMIVSISNAQDVRRSAGSWKRKLLTRNAASIVAGMRPYGTLRAADDHQSKRGAPVLTQNRPEVRRLGNHVGIEVRGVDVKTIDDETFNVL